MNSDIRSFFGAPKDKSAASASASAPATPAPASADASVSPPPSRPRAQKRRTIVVSDDDDDDAGTKRTKVEPAAHTPRRSSPVVVVPSPTPMDVEVRGGSENGGAQVESKPAPTRRASAASAKAAAAAPAAEASKASTARAPRRRAAPAAGARTTAAAARRAARNAPRFSEDALRVLQSVPLVNVDSMGVMAAGTFADRPTTMGEQGSKPIPSGQPGCLSGLSFVITGILETLTRQEAGDLIKQYGGKVTGAPSTKTDFVVLGDNAGPRKVETIKTHNIRAIDEDGLLFLISHLPENGGSGAAAQAVQAKREQERVKLEQTAQEFARADAAHAAKISATGENGAVDSRLWTDKYAPTSLKDICGNKGLVQKLQSWLHSWPNARAANFSRPGPDGLGLYRAVLISGPPGIGKTTAAHLVAHLEDYDVLEFNASDTRSKRMLDEHLLGVTDSRSLAGYLQGPGGKRPDANKQRLVLIMDEVDGMSAGDRGGVGQLNTIIKKTRIPIICICNDRASPKLRPLDRTTFDMRFRRPDANSLRSRIMSIAYREQLKLAPAAVDQLVQGTHSDIRQIINILSAWRLGQSSLSPAESTAVAKASQKHIVLKPWDICNRYLHGNLFHPSSNVSINDKLELYFNDHEFSYLMVQENYLSTRPDRLRQEPPKIAKLKHLELISKAADSISQADLVDSLIHGSQQQWSLMPTHALLSCVRPASFVSGFGTRQTVFTTWLGNNSKGNKLMRMLRELQLHMRLKISADRIGVREQYLPLLFSMLHRRFATDKGEAVPDMIELMDEYYLTREDFDAVSELMLPADLGEQVLKGVPSAAKSAFTRKYNSMSHPIPFMGASDILPTKGPKTVEAPNLEDVIEAEDEMDDGGDDEDGDGNNDDELDLTKDKFVSVSKKGKKTASRASAKAKTAAKTTRGRGRGRGRPRK
ncbi:DNA replication factor C complex subunit Rfc1 [Schizosaccharomyces japonicus yFS275]|uniref:Replication factor C subunit 1 n=1 Tax=Schizosaccharomyces japonicus (strain yFS275 / FY16936) TaxID=402676 RepID=B6JWT8_SCHJY|nr:DNA replication factor C complex subunit Rfc1 [Schizosaccharomyces japonicus yFS275]EEB05839.1 DNA replication factor C complex subunit Rfc1 [Schizosaccharomyces japonicus yFS275]